MNIPRLGTSEPDMSAAVSLARSLEHRERSRVSSLKVARERVASRLRIGVGTFENLVRGRVKKIDATIRDRLQALLVRELEAEILRLSHELEMARQIGSHPASQHIGEIEAHLAKINALMRGRGA
jgi:hypothetical protein